LLALSDALASLRRFEFTAIGGLNEGDQARRWAERLTKRVDQN
jgi:hypothetical protein